MENHYQNFFFIYDNDRGTFYLKILGIFAPSLNLIIIQKGMKKK